MATLHKEIHIEARPEAIWDAARDLGALHTRLVPGFRRGYPVGGHRPHRHVRQRDGGARADHLGRRPGPAAGWTAIGGRTTHYNAVLEVLADRSGTRVVWATDLLPDEMAEPIARMQENGLAAMKETFERRA